MTQRSGLQNRSLHKACRNVADALNDAGYDFNDGEIIRLPVPFTMENVKEYMFKRIMSAMYPERESTADLTTVEMQRVYEVMERHLAQNCGISIPWPSEETRGEG